MMRRQIAKLNHRVMAVELENQQAQQREMVNFYIEFWWWGNAKYIIYYTIWLLWGDGGVTLWWLFFFSGTDCSLLSLLSCQGNGVVEQVFLVLGALETILSCLGKVLPAAKDINSLRQWPLDTYFYLSMVFWALFSHNQPSVQDFAHSTLFQISWPVSVSSNGKTSCPIPYLLPLQEVHHTR